MWLLTGTLYLILLSHTQTHIAHLGASRLTHPYKYKYYLLCAHIRSSHSEVFLKKRCSENIQQIYRTLMPKCNFNKVALEMSGTVKRHYFLKAEESLLSNITFLAQSFLVSKLYMGILTRFGNFGANICLIHSTCCLTGCIFA